MYYVAVRRSKHIFIVVKSPHCKVLAYFSCHSFTHIDKSRFLILPPLFNYDFGFFLLPTHDFRKVIKTFMTYYFSNVFLNKLQIERKGIRLCYYSILHCLGINASSYSVR